MAFGFPWANYKEKVDTPFDKEELRSAVLRTFKQLGWTPELRGPDKYRVLLRDPDGRSLDEYVTVTLLGSGAFMIKSRCVYIQIVDWGKNKEHVEEFKSQFAKP